jgi:hypothetical protein
LYLSDISESSILVDTDKSKDKTLGLRNYLIRGSRQLRYGVGGGTSIGWKVTISETRILSHPELADAFHRHWLETGFFRRKNGANFETSRESGATPAQRDS